jgi:GT2 family glycosyltransferase
MNSVAVIVLNWNGVKDTLKCLDSLIAQDYKKLSVIVVDNGSVDDSLGKIENYIQKTDFDITLRSNKKNLGFAGGVNTGIRYALENKFDGIALFNNDAVADKKWVSSLVKCMDDKKVGIVTGLLLHADGKTIDSSGDWVSTWGLAFPRNRGDSADKAPEAGFVFGGSGGGSLYRAKVFKDIGLFDETFFVYYEDADVSFRAQLAGWQVYYTPKAVAYHKQGASSKKVPGLTLYHTFKNLPLVFLKNTPGKLLLPVGARFYLSYWLIVGNAIKNGDGKPVLKGVFASIPRGFGALVKRNKIQRNKKVSSTYIKSILWPDLPPDQTGMRKFRKFFTGKS